MSPFLHPTFSEWMKLVDQKLIALCGLTSADLPDAPYRDFFDDGMEPDEAAQEALELAQ